MIAKWIILFGLFCLFWHGTAQYHQTDYKIYIKIIKISDYKHSYGRDPKLGMQWYNRTTRVINGNFTLTKDVGINLKMTIQMYKFMSNEYRFFPITFSMNLCEELPKNSFGMKYFVRKFTKFPLVCPFRKGYYHVVHGQIDFTQFPPYISSGD